MLIIQARNTAPRCRLAALNIKRRYSVKQFKGLAHAVWQCKYHVVWCPKYRLRILKGEIGRSVRDIISEIRHFRSRRVSEGQECHRDIRHVIAQVCRFF